MSNEITKKVGQLINKNTAKVKANKIIKFDLPDKKLKCVLHILKNKKTFSLSLDVYNTNDNSYAEDFGVSVEGWATWKKTKSTFLEIIKDNFSEGSN